MSKRNQRKGVPDGCGGWKLRVFHKKGMGKQSPRYRIKCGCCDSEVDIYYNRDGLEINGVYASLESWREILIPLLTTDQQ